MTVTYLSLKVFKGIGNATGAFISKSMQSILMKDKISVRIVGILKKSDEPLETMEIERMIPKATRVMVLNRLKDLRGDGKIKGKRVGAGSKGVWIWWS